jgi:hypothetical protein
MSIITMVRFLAAGHYCVLSFPGVLTEQEAALAVERFMRDVKTDRATKVEVLVYHRDERSTLQ